MGTSTSTIVFTDVVGSTAMRARLGEEAADRLFRALERAQAEVIDAGAGRVVKTGGDGVMAAFDSATDAVRACVAVQQRMSRDFPDVRLRVGAAAGDVGWEDGDCFGMPVVAAARLQAGAEGGQILVGALVRLLAGERAGVTFTSVGALTLAGIPEPVDAYAIDWAPLDPGTAGRAALALPLPAAMQVTPPFGFVGREDETAALDEAAVEARRGARRTVLVGGEAGAGKTRLAFEFARRRHAEDAIVLLGSCDAELGMPYQPWVDVLGQLVRAMPAETAAEHTGHLAELLALLPELERLVPGLRRPAPADPETERYRLFQAVDALLVWAARDRELVVVLDDLHWAGTQTLALLRHIARSSEPAGLVVIGTFRDTGDEISDPLAACLADLRRVESSRRVRVVGLGQADVERFVVDAVGRELDPSLRSLATMLTERSGGNAFYLGELWRHLQGTGVIVQGHGRAEVRAAASIGVPDGVREVVAARLARLDPTARHVVELIATAGLRADARVLHVAGEGLPLGRALDDLVQAKLLVEIAGPSPVYQFAHALVRDTIEQQASAAGRAERHRRIAQAIEQVYEADRRPVLAELSRHYVAAAALGEADRAVYYARRAASQAMRSNADEEAIVHLEAAQALSSPGTPAYVQLLLDLGTCRTQSGLDPAAIDVYHGAFESAREQGLVRETALAVLGLSHARQLRGRAGAELLAMVEQAIAMLGEDDLVLLIRLRSAEALQLHLEGRQEEADAIAKANLAHARQLGVPAAELAVLEGQTIYGDQREYLATTLEGAALVEQLGDYWHYCDFVGGIVRAYLQLGDLIEAASWLERLRHVSSRGRYGMWRYQVGGLDSLFALVRGDFDEAERLAAAAVELLPEGTEFVAGIYGLQMYAVRREQGRLAEVAPVLRLAAANNPGGLWRPGLAALFVQVGMLDDARRTFDALAADRFAVVPRDSMWPACLAFLAEVCLALGDTTHAVPIYEDLSAHAGYTVGAPFTVCFGPADCLRGSLAALLGRRDEARKHFEAALAMAERSGSPVWVARVQHDWSVALGERPDLLEQALITATRLGMSDLAASATGALAGRIDRASPEPSLPDGLSVREVDVLRLVAAGRSNRAIGDELFISQNTVANHVRSILQKTGTANRAEATAYAARRGLLT